MESDIDSLLAAATSDSSDSESHPFRRTVDDILKEDSSSSSSSSSSPLSSPLSFQSSYPKPRPPSPPLPPQAPEEPPPKLTSASSLPALSLRGYSHPRALPSLFDRVRSNPRPGAALAAAAAASRSVLTPHAAAIKSRRAGIPEKVVVVSEDAAVEERTNEHGSGIGTERSGEEGVLEPVVSDDKVEVVDEEEDDSVELVKACSLDSDVAAATEDGDGVGCSGAIGDVEDAHSPSPDSVAAVVEDGLELGEDLRVQDTETEGNDVGKRDSVIEEKEDSNLAEVGSTRSVVVSLEEGIPNLERTKSVRKADKKLRATMKPLEWAEELEKRQASSGLHWEEGVAAQPMRLKGIGRGPPAVGYLQIEGDNAITRSISSQVVRTNHGSLQAMAVHMSFIAVGTSKGSVLVVPSKYSAHSADTMDSKMLVLGSQSEKPLSPATSLCFNQHGDLLLVGYGNGHVILWDVQRATAAKMIIGEHNAPIIHMSFLVEDSQITRQFKAITGDSKGFILLHTFSVVPLLNRYSVKSQYLVDGKKSETVLSISPLFVGTSQPSGISTSQGNPTVSSSGLGSMMGGVVGGDVGWKLFNEGTSSMEEGVVIFVTHKQALVVRLTPSFEHYDTLPKPDGIREGSIPYSAWTRAPFTRVPFKDESDSGIPWLIIAWDRKIQVIKLVKTKLERYREWSLDSAAIGVSWLDDQMLVILTLRGHLCLFTKDGTEIHRTNFILDGAGGDDAIAYHTHFINSFGNPEKAYNNSFAVRGATVYILGTSHLTISRLLPWKERIQVLQRAGDWMGALDMSMRLYDGQAHGVIDLPRTTDDIRKMIMPYLIELLYSYVDEVFSYISLVGQNNQHNGPAASGSSAHEELDEQFARAGGVAVEFCLHINRTDILFDDIFSKFVAVQHGGIFLEVLEPYILKDMLGCLPPEIMQALVEHYSSKGWLQRVEQCVLHMEISSLDFNQIIKLCREHGLYGALIYLFNKGLGDYKTPLEELLAVVKNLRRADAAAIGYRMLVYLKYCFLGLAFPPGHGSIPFSRQLSLREELLQFLLEDSNVLSSPVMSAFKTTCGASPNLWYLLWLDTEATLGVLRLALLEDKVPSTDITSQNTVDSSVEMSMEHPCENLDSWRMTQNTVNSLIYCLDMESEVIRSFNMDKNEFPETWPSKKDVGHMVDFIAFFVACKQAAISKNVLKHLLEYLTVREDSEKSEAHEKEKQVVSLLNVLPEKDWNDSSVLNLFAESQYYQACGLIQTIRGQYVEALESYMKDLNEPAHTFAFIHKMMLQLKGSECLSLRAAIVSRLPELIKISREGAFFLILDHFREEAPHILSELQSNSASLFLFLKAAIEVHLQGKLDFSALERSRASKVPFGMKVKPLPDDFEAYLERLSDFPKFVRHNPFHVTDEIAGLYLELLCQYESRSVLKFLKTFENYSLEHCLRLCQDHGITDAASFLLERAGDVGGALVQAMSGLDEDFLSITSAVQHTLDDVTRRGTIDVDQLDIILSLDEVKDVHDVLGTSIGLCQRNTPRLNPQESESLWFRLLDRFSEPLRKLCYDKGVLEGEAYAATSSGIFNVQRGRRISKSCSVLKRIFSLFVKEIIEGMIGYVPLPAIVNKLLSDNKDQEFGDFKFTILGMLGTYGFERRILDTAKSLIEDDTFYTMNLLKKGASHGYSPQSFICCICGCSLTKDSPASGIRIFSCGHATHLHCESLENETLDMIRLAGCPICMPKRKIAHPRSKSILMDNGLIRNSTSGGRSFKSAKNVQHFLEPEQIERPYGTQQISRFEILSNLHDAQKSLQIDGIPQLRLAPPAMYHDKVQKGTSGLLGESSLALVKTERPNKGKGSESKSKGLSKHFPLKASIFGSEKTRTGQRHGSRS